MGKPKGSSLKRIQKLKQNLKISHKSHDKDELMEKLADQMDQKMGENTESTFTPTPVVLEDIKIHTLDKNSKVSKKKEKRKLKRNNLLARLESSNAVRIQTRKAKERAKAVIVGDMQPLMDALPDVPITQDEHSTKGKSKQLSGKKKNWSDKKSKVKQKEELKDIDLFKTVMQLPGYKQDPICAIANHVEYMVKGNLL